ncbi:MAG: GNAT family N-acetyltransferase [Roseibium sp.]
MIGDFAGVASGFHQAQKKAYPEEFVPADPSAMMEDHNFPPEFGALISRSAAYCPTNPHWYLGLIAVDPAYRGRGVGTKLLEFCLTIVDHDELPAYLESTNAANLSLYKRFGFQQLAEVSVGSSPIRFPMFRAARAS